MVMVFTSIRYTSIVYCVLCIVVLYICSSMYVVLQYYRQGPSTHQP